MGTRRFLAAAGWGRSSGEGVPDKPRHRGRRRAQGGPGHEWAAGRCRATPGW